MLEEQRRNGSVPTVPTPRSTSQAAIDIKLAAAPGIAEELQAARKKSDEAAEKDRQTKANERAEEENLLEAKRTEAMGEWYVHPLNMDVDDFLTP